MKKYEVTFRATKEQYEEEVKTVRKVVECDSDINAIKAVKTTIVSGYQNNAITSNIELDITIRQEFIMIDYVSEYDDEFNINITYDKFKAIEIE